MSIAGGETLIDRLTPTRANTHLTDRETRIIREGEREPSSFEFDAET